MIIIVLIRFYQNTRASKLLQKAKKEIGIIKEIHYSTAVRGGSSNAKIQFYINDKKFIFEQRGDFRLFNIGDTILIKYSTLDPSVATVIDKYYMKKYKHIKSK